MLNAFASKLKSSKGSTSSGPVRTGLLQRACACGQHTGGGGTCEACKGKAERGLQRAAADKTSAFEPPESVQETLRTPGQPLEPSTRAFMEPRFGQDFSHVRVHADARAAASAQAVHAHAYTVGQDVVFGAGRYAPHSPAGRALIAHELTHVVQQSSAAPAMQSRSAISQPGDAAELEAESVSRAVMAGGAVPAIGSAAPSVQRQDGAGAGSRAPAQRRTIWVNVGFDSSAQANETTMAKLRASIAAEKAAIASCCSARSTACDVDVKTHYDWNRVNKPAPTDHDYDDDSAADRALRDSNLANISGPANGRKVLVTESTLSQTWQGVRIFPRANTGASGILWNRALAADDTIAHESGHAAGYAGDAEGGAHSSDPDNLMSPGSIRHAGALPDANWCTQMAGTAQ
ncbi:hypothetical protein GETHLI_01420 [Geothrix limicola]|uniref:eCIS core domain-containing protein n=1 Tax=Geothrix limicola TaxID=2927978 RepID=A0ABQ5QB17_9BACT|nr:DUF4157 domain-containing protein [Geothrix limicola]GLH71640.1 hypothetical protein GETHLI_01420 [Geothrix limicola]